MSRSSRLSGFYQKSIAERVAVVAEWAALTPAEVALLADGLSVAEADKMVENVVGRYSLPLGIATNFLLNGEDFLVPMVIEEPSVVAAVSFAARLARTGGGFRTGSSEPIMVAQVQLLDVPDADVAAARIMAARAELLDLADTSPTIRRLGGGPRGISVRRLPQTPTGPMLIVHLHVDVRDAMGANVVNTAAEAIAPVLERLSGGRALLRILTNLTDERRAWAAVTIPARAFANEDFDGAEVVANIAHANAFAVADPYRAATHNKGILNGVDAVALATGNDWRAIEAGAHAWAAREGRYKALTDWRVLEGPAQHPVPPLPVAHAPVAHGTMAVAGSGLQTTGSGPTYDGPWPALYGRLEMPLSVGTVGGATRTHPVAPLALRVLGNPGARKLAEVMVAVGLAQNLAALRALATEGIQRGHMSLHARQVAVAAGAQGSAVDQVAARMVAEGQIRVDRAREILQERLV
ncbi:MAG: hydroxymethylglutaryl-CoA reductase, degradative [Caldilineaceae bacterium]